MKTMNACIVHVQEEMQMILGWVPSVIPRNIAFNDDFIIKQVEVWLKKYLFIKKIHLKSIILKVFHKKI